MALTKENLFKGLQVTDADSITVNSHILVKDGSDIVAENQIGKRLQPYAIVDGAVVEVDLSGEHDLVQKVAAKLWTKSVKDSVKAEMEKALVTD